MLTWWAIIISIILLGKYIDTNGVYYREGSAILQRGSKVAYCLATGIMIFFAGLRSVTGEGTMSIGDTRVYNTLFDNVVKNNIVEFIRSTDFEGDWGFYALMSFFRGLFHANNQALFFICSLITLGCLFYRYYKLNLTDKESLFFLFITFGIYASTMNGVRQWFASALLFLIFPLIEKRKWAHFFAFTLLISMIHSSAFIFLIFYFFVNKKAWGSTMKGMIICAIFLVVSYPVTGRYISLLLAESENFSQYSNHILLSGYGANIIRIILYILPIIFAYYFRNNMMNEPNYDIIINFAILDMLFMLLALTNWIYARFCIYLDPFLLIVYSWILKYCFTKRSRNLARILFYSLFLVYFWYQMYIGYGGQIYTSKVLGIG